MISICFPSPASSAEKKGKPAKEAATPAPAEGTAPPPPQPVKLDIDEYVIEGVDILPQAEVEAAVYPFLGPNRSSADVEKARSALEKSYHDKGFQTVIVEIPPQNAEKGVVRLKATEGKVGRLTVNGSKYFSPEVIKKSAPSVAEGKVPNFNDVQKDIVALNQWPDRRVTPALRAGTTPGTIDVDLNVEDKFPLHGSLEFNNRQSIGTTASRLSSSARYDNLWQRGDSINFSYNVAPERPNDATSFSSSYLFRDPKNDYLSYLVYGVKSDSDVTTVGGVNVVGPGTIVGTRALLTLPTRDNLFHSISVGIDYKNFEERIRLAGLSASTTPIEYYPFTANYTAGLQGDGYKTELNTGIVFHIRGMGSDPFAFDEKRFGASGDFFIYKGDIAHTQELPFGTQLYGKVRGQIASVPLVSSEEFSGGGLDTVRGYLESEVLGDNALAGTVELRSPDIPTLFFQLTDDAKAPADASKASSTDSIKINDWRVYAFADRAWVGIISPLPEQKSRFDLASYGVGSRIRLLDYVNGSIDYAIPIFDQTKTKEGDGRVTFRVWGEF